MLICVIQKTSHKFFFDKYNLIKFKNPHHIKTNNNINRNIPLINTKITSMAFTQIGLGSLETIPNVSFDCTNYAHFKYKFKKWLYST